ncbi:MAG: hypothetical protein KME07_16110 [Pegethrix bostrychoides GSE-TBD4-15B]|uniref:Uncharacterized protein n=1 Tax=Pegethrix bostrychoides GSE-TBD4-15B TaxID=2839662 RepID=A0A951U5N1_9CYAN|nr:hypothetical protein [Pegethrix bostrychoides GSE-TBD4-15B]
MFVDELTPVIKELAGYPIAFLGGFASGLLRLNLAEEPAKSWLAQTGISVSGTAPTHNGNGPQSNGPQSISID